MPNTSSGLPHHFSDYGFDPQITHFQFTEESRRHGRRASFKPIDAVRFKLQKPISKDESRRSAAPTSASGSKTKKKRWWKNALGYLKSKWAEKNRGPSRTEMALSADSLISGPIYVTESRSRPIQPYTGFYNTTPFGAMKGCVEREIPYVSLREINIGEQQRISTSAMPIYLVT